MGLPLESNRMHRATPGDVEQALAEFSRAAIALAKILQEGPELSHLQRLSVENNLAIVQLNYTYWTRQLSPRKYPHSVQKK